LDSGTTLQPCETTPTVVCSLNVTAPTVFVAPSTSINANGRGYVGAQNTGSTAWGSGNSQLAGAGPNQGGSHGGRGLGSNNYGAQPMAATTVYGNYTAPSEPGGGAGGASVVGQPGVDGGGFIRITASSGLVVDGTILANGNGASSTNNHWAPGSTPSWSGGGAGGGIDLVVGTLAGSGTIQANGGSCAQGQNGSCGGGGAGGRIAVRGYSSLSGNFTLANVADNIRAFGGAGGGIPGNAALNAGAGTVYLRSATETYGSLIVDNNNSTALADSTPILLVPQAQLVTVTATTLGDPGASFPAGRFVNTWVNPDINQPGSANGLMSQSLYRISSHTANVLTVTGSGLTAVAQTGDIYRGVLALDRLSVRRRADVIVPGEVLVTSGNVGAANASTFTLDGTLEAIRMDINLTGAVNVTQGALQVGDLIANGNANFGFDMTVGANTSITESNTNVSSLNIAAGGLLTTGNLTATGNVTVNGNLVAADVAVGGTLALSGTTATSVVSDVSAGVFDMNNGLFTLDSLLTTGNATLRGNAQLTVAGPASASALNVDIGGALALQETSRMWHPEATTSQVFMLNVEADTIAINASASIDVTGRGYLGGSGAIGNQGFTFGNTTSGGATDRIGGTHGGLGAIGNAGGSSPIAYGSLYDPMLPGGGGARNIGQGFDGTDGGGVVWLTATSAITVDGTILADGRALNNNNNSNIGGGGAGGSIRIVTPLLNGAGTIGARGANGGSSWGGGAGGGGRVSIAGVSTFGGNFVYDTIWTGVRAHGGLGWNSLRGGAGTIYVHRAGDTYGSLVVDNQDSSNVAQDSTPLVSLPGGTIASLPANNQLTDTSGNWTTNFFVGSWITPNIAQGNAARRNDDQIFPITANTLQTLTLGSNINGVAAAGNTYRGIYRFRNVELRNRGNLRVTGDLVIEQGDLSSGNTSTLSLPANTRLSCNVLDLHTNLPTSIVLGSGAVNAATTTVGGP
jgi:hypothetical protein